jgi:gamma-glutamyl-gamma-aminobutyrate hydrolase PuuD
LNRIYVCNGPSYASAVEGLGEIFLSQKAFFDDPTAFSLVLFTGGADVSPSFYGDTSPDGYCYTNERRDFEEEKVFHVARDRGIPMAGICRGVQFLNVMAGGKMMHHLDGHTGPNHRMSTLVSNEPITVNTLHHQMILPAENAHIIGWSTERQSQVYFGANDQIVDYAGREVEAAIFPEIRAVGVQYHPEMMSEQSKGYAFFYNMVKAAMERPIEEVVKLYTQGDERFGYYELRSRNAGFAG